MQEQERGSRIPEVFRGLSPGPAGPGPSAGERIMMRMILLRARRALYHLYKYARTRELRHLYEAQHYYYTKNMRSKIGIC